MVTFKTYENLRDPDFWRAGLCELLATAILLFIGCGSVVLHAQGDVTTTSADVVRIALAFGLTVTVLVKTFGPISGCHVNPAVSLAMLAVGKISLVRAALYIFAQMLGALIGTGWLCAVVPSEKRRNLGLTSIASGIDPWQAVGVEASLTALLLLVISACCDEGRREHHHTKATNPLLIGFTVTLLHLMAVPLTGSSLNPARSFAPAMIDWYWANHWVYWVGPIAGGCIGAIIYRSLIAPSSSATDNRPVIRTVSESVPHLSTVEHGMVSYESSLSVVSSASSSNAMNSSQVPLVTTSK